MDKDDSARRAVDPHRSAVATEFERHRPYLRGVAYRMLGSMADAEDALQECWLRLDRARPSAADDLKPWLTTVLSRICLDALRARRARREAVPATWLPEPVVVALDTPEEDAIRADAVGLALLVVLETLVPAERLAFVLHDVFAVPFEQIALIVGRSPEASRQLASRARRRVRDTPPRAVATVAANRAVVDAFLAAARGGELAALLELLDPQVSLRLDTGANPAPVNGPVRGAERVAEFLRTGAPIFAPLCRPAGVNGGPGIVVGPPGRVIGVVGLTMANGRIWEIDIVADPAKLGRVREAGW
jgi:RNA polymerase sigma factor (sigma-70 family)